MDVLGGIFSCLSYFYERYVWYGKMARESYKIREQSFYKKAGYGICHILLCVESSWLFVIPRFYEW